MALRQGREPDARPYAATRSPFALASGDACLFRALNPAERCADAEMAKRSRVRLSETVDKLDDGLDLDGEALRQRTNPNG